MPSPSRAARSTALLLCALTCASACKDKKPEAPIRLPELMDQASLDRAKGKGPQFNPAAEGFEYLYQDEGEAKRQTHLTAARAEPGAQGTKVLTRPRAVIALSPTQTLVLTATKATFTMPGNKPRDGLFAGSPADPVVFTLYECKAGEKIDLASAKQVQMRVFFDGDARFDLERDEVESSAPVQVTGPQMDLCGTGLQLTWNQLDERMEQLDIRQGQVLCCQAPDKNDAKKEGGKDGTPATTVLGKAQAARSLHTPSSNDLVMYWSGPLQLRSVDGAETSGDEKPAQTLTHYRAVLEKEVRGTQHAPEPQDEVHFSGERMDMDFAIKPVQKDKAEKTPAAGAAPLPGLPAEGTGENDVLTLAGTDAAPASVRTGKGETIRAASLTYARGSGRVAAKGSEGAPVSLRTPDGWLTGTRLDLDPGTGKAFVFGPGQLESAGLRKKAGTPETKGETKEVQDAPLRASYGDHIELDFTTKPAKPGQAPRIGDPVETRLIGDIKASHPDFTLACGRLALGFGKGEPVGKNGKARTVLDRVDISEETPVISLRDPKQGTVTIKAPAMRLKVAQVGERTLPAGFTATGPVEAVQGDGSTLACNQLDVDFVTPDKNNANAKPAVRSLHAAGSARYNGKLKDDPVALSGDSFTVNAIDNTLDLAGTADKWGAIESQGMSLAGEKVFLQKDSGVARVDGPGRLTLNTKEKQHLAVSWQGKMTWNDAIGVGQFEKAVECAADGPNGASTLHAEESLALRVDPGRTPGEKKDADAKRDLRLADAKGKVVFTGTQSDDDGKLAGRVRVDGPNLLVVNEATEANPRGAQTVGVTGQGLMLVENFKQEDGAKDASFSGRGATFFAWKKSMLMDVAKNDLHLLHDVTIRHRALKDNGQYAPDAEDVILNAQEAHADLTEGGGLGGLHGKERKSDAKVAMREIKCDHGVTIRRQGERIASDHLLFKAEKNAAALWCDPPRRVELFAKGQDIPASADRVIWHTDENRLEVDHPSGGLMPQWK